MPRKSTGSVTTRSKKNAATSENAAVQPTPVQVAPAVHNEIPNQVRKNGSSAATHASMSLDEEIRFRAYQLYLERNGEAGDPNADWLVAEREVRARHATAGR